MGLFSWKTSDTGRSIPCEGASRDTFTVHLLMPDGTKDSEGNVLKMVTEDSYTGYGEFAGIDVYAWLARVNTPEDCQCKDPLNTDPKLNDIDRMVGIDLTFKTPEKINYTIKLVEMPCGYESVSESENCPDQGYFYDDCMECGSEDTYSDSRCRECYDEYMEEEERLAEEEDHTCDSCTMHDEAITNSQCMDCYDEVGELR
jgi:hypothetical protein